MAAEAEEEAQTFELDIGVFTGHLDPASGRPSGHGVLVFNPEDPQGRRRYSGQWQDGQKTGSGSMEFASGDSYRGGFRQGVPHGEGQFRYSDGQTEDAVWEDGQRHGLSRFRSVGGTEEEILFWEGQARGPAKLRRTDGSVEERTYKDGLVDGPARLFLPNGDKAEYTYKAGVISGEATYYGASSGATETCQYVDGVKHGPSVERSANGDQEERVYAHGSLDGPAVLYGANGDKLEFVYSPPGGRRSGRAVYTWADGSREVSLYDDLGEQTGPAKLTWGTGASREGNKVKGAWHGEVFYTYAEGPRAGRRDKEIWEHGELVSSQKFYGQGETVEVEDWEDLKKLEDLTKTL